ncbi:MAG: flotillin [candidate division Zixibacteria bacterium]|nr:flotillin [candidate division Zixibacteria bacterium]
MSPISLIILIVAIAAVVGLIALLFQRNYRNVGPNEVLIISGGKQKTVTEPDGTSRMIGYRMRIGGGTFVKPFIEQAERLPIDILTVNIKTPEVLTKNGISISAEGQAQVKVGSEDWLIRRAAEQFLGKGQEGMRDVSGQVIEGYMRGQMGSMSVEEIYQNRDDFAVKLKDDSKNDFQEMGLEIVSFALKDISDAQGYIEAMGLPRIARVKADAAVAQAEADRDSTINAANARKEGDIAKFAAESEVAAANRDYEVKRAEYTSMVNQKKASADMAYDLERHKQNQAMKKEELATRLVEKESGIKVEEAEIKRKELELEATVKKMADADKYRTQSEAESNNFKVIQQAKAKAEAIRLEGDAEAEAMKKRAESYKEFNEAAMYKMFVDVLPELAKNISEPLSKVDKIIMVGDGAGGASKLTGQVANIMAQLPEVVESLSGVDLKKMLKKLGNNEGENNE